MLVMWYLTNSKTHLSSKLYTCYCPVIFCLKELSVADSFFIAKPCSVTGLAAIINSLDGCYATMPSTERSQYLNHISGVIGVRDNDEVLAAQRRLQLSSSVNGD